MVMEETCEVGYFSVKDRGGFRILSEEDQSLPPPESGREEPTPPLKPPLVKDFHQNFISVCSQRLISYSIW